MVPRLLGKFKGKKNDRNTKLRKKQKIARLSVSDQVTHGSRNWFAYATAVVGAAVATGAASVLASTAATAAAGAVGAAATAASTAGAGAGTGAEAASALVGQSREMWPAWAHL